MPVLMEILSADGKFLKDADPATPHEVRYVRNYFLGQLSSVIGAECLTTEMGGVIHLVQDPETILAIEHGETDIAGVLGEATAVLGIYPETDPVKIPFTSMKGYMGNVAMRHAFPECTIVYN